MKTSELPSTWGWRIKRAGLTQAKLADSLGISPATITHAIKGRSKPTTETIEKVEEVLKNFENTKD